MCVVPRIGENHSNRSPSPSPIVSRYIDWSEFTEYISSYDVAMSHDREPDDDDYRRLLDLRTGLREFLRWSEQQATAVGITPAQHQLLLAVRGNSDREGPTIGDLADALLLRHHSAVGLVDRAVDAGLVSRHADAIDHRVVRLRLTPLGAPRLR